MGDTATPATVDRSAERLLEAKVRDLEKDNRKYRLQLRAYRELGSVEDLKKRLPAEGSTVLSAEDAKVLEQYKTLGKPEDLEKSVKERDELKLQVSAQEHEKAVAAAAEATGYNVKVLAKLPGTDKLKFEVKKEKVDGEDVDVAYVTDTAAQGATPQKLKEWVEANHSDLLPALENVEAAQHQERSESSSREFPAQRPASKSGGGARKGEDEFRRATQSTATYVL